MAAGERGAAPASVVVLSGDVHHAYLCEAWYPADGARAPIYQAVCAPYRNPLSKKERTVIRTAFSAPFVRTVSALAKLSGVPDPGIGWRLLDGPCFDNQVATLRISGRRATMRLDKTVAGDRDQQSLECSFERELA